MSNDYTIFSITIDDVESILCRQLTEEEGQLFLHKFSIDDWVEYVDTFLDMHGISLTTQYKI